MVTILLMTIIGNHDYQYRCDGNYDCVTQGGDEVGCTKKVGRMATGLKHDSGL